MSVYRWEEDILDNSTCWRRRCGKCEWHNHPAHSKHSTARIISNKCSRML